MANLLMDEKDVITEIEDDEVESLTRELNSVRVVLKDANRSRSSSPSEILKHFVKVLSTVVNQAENLIDQFVIEAKLHQKKTHTKALRFMLCCLKGDLLLDMIHQVTRNIKQYQYLTEEALVEEVRKHLLPERYLVVLGDLWTLEALEDVKIALPNNLKRRESMVANMCCDDCPHHLKFLQKEGFRQG
ncbi:hypothetical protein BC332_34144 [Capsicum chinense]|nr:hypothetical protein BC332_34144 [Capsicum chinense]